MAKRLVFVLGCLLCAFSLSVGDEVPSIAISCGRTPLSTLPKFQHSMDTLVFKKLLSGLWNEDTKVVMVMEDELSLEDLTMKDTDGHGFFKVFENSEERRFFPSVDQPEKAIELLSKNGFSIKAYNDETYVNGSEKVVALVDFHENNHHNDRHSILQKHNNDISKIFNTLCKQYTNVVLLISGKLNPWIQKAKASNTHHLVTRHLMAVENKPTKQLIIQDEKKKSLLYSKSYPTLTLDNGPAIELQAAPSADVTLDDGRDGFLKVGTRFLFNGTTMVTLRFRYKASKSSWNLEKVEYENLGETIQLSPKVSVGAPKGMSFFSEGPVIFADKSVVLKFNNKFQVEPWLSSSGKFRAPEEQNEFFSAPILAGLFVVFILLFIVTWGIIMIMDIKTMDRFDDPKGKTISINVVE